MSHRTYQTDAIVLAAANLGEANRELSLLTRDLGLVRALARSVREERSKLRYSLQPFSLSRISLVRGRERWRVTGAEARGNLAQKLAGSPAARAAAARVAALLSRLLPEEGSQSDVFTVVLAAFSHLARVRLGPEELAALECLTVLRVLSRLGYVAPGSLASFVAGSALSPATLRAFGSRRREAVRAVNAALAASQL